MKDNTFQKSIEFQNKPDGLAAVLASCIACIEEQTELLAVPVTNYPKIKWAITELLINGAKHSGTRESKLWILLGPNHLTLEKEDFGNPLKLEVNAGAHKLVWPLDEPFLNTHYEIYQNGVDALQVFTSGPDHAIFNVNEIEEIQMPALLLNTSEHFGLMIIAKASDRFVYQYDPHTGKNTFSVTFFYPE